MRRGVFLFACFVLLDFSLAFAEEFRYDNHGRRDPFIPVTEVSRGTLLGSGELRLEGIVIDQAGSSYVLVNGQVLREGEELEGFALKKVEPNRAFFEKEGETFEAILSRDDELLKQYLENQEAT